MKSWAGVFVPAKLQAGQLGCVVSTPLEGGDKNTLAIMCWVQGEEGHWGSNRDPDRLTLMELTFWRRRTFNK